MFPVGKKRVEPAKDRVRLKLWLPFLHMISDYDLDGKILMMPITGKGMSEGNYSELFAPLPPQPPIYKSLIISS